MGVYETAMIEFSRHARPFVPTHAQSNKDTVVEKPNVADILTESLRKYPFAEQRCYDYSRREEIDEPKAKQL